MTKAALGFLGPLGTFTHEAANNLLGEPEELAPLGSVAEVYQAVSAAHADTGAELTAGVVPIENTVEGYVVPSLDQLLAAPDVVAVDQTVLDISFTAMRIRGDDSAPTAVVSHPHGLAQCRNYIAELGLPAIESSSNAAACRDLKPGQIALGPKICQELYDRVEVAAAVEDFHGARTRFLRIAHRSQAQQWLAHHSAAGAAEQLATMLAITPDTAGPGVLSHVVNSFGDRGINLTSLITRPLKATEGRYAFVFTMDGHPAGPALRAAVQSCLDQGYWVKLLGFFPVSASTADLDLSAAVPAGSVHQGAPSADIARELLWQ